MPRPEKVEKVEELAARFRSASGVVLTEFRGLTVKDATELRRTLREAGASLEVVKNTLARLAVGRAGVDGLARFLEGPTALAFLEGDPVAGAKVLLEATRRFPAVTVKGALIEGTVLDGEGARSLATLDSKEVSLARVAGALQAPVSRLAYLLRAPLQRLAYALAERARQAA